MRMCLNFRDDLSKFVLFVYRTFRYDMSCTSTHIYIEHMRIYVHGSSTSARFTGGSIFHWYIFMYRIFDTISDNEQQKIKNKKGTYSVDYIRFGRSRLNSWTLRSTTFQVRNISTFFVVEHWPIINATKRFQGATDNATIVSKLQETPDSYIPAGAFQPKQIQPLVSKPGQVVTASASKPAKIQPFRPILATGT